MNPNGAFCRYLVQMMTRFGTISWPAENISNAMKLSGAFWRVLRFMLDDFYGCASFIFLIFWREVQARPNTAPIGATPVMGSL